MCHLVTGGDQVCQAGPAFHKPTLAGPDPLVVLYTLCDVLKVDLHNLAHHGGQIDRPVIPQILLPALCVSDLLTSSQLGPPSLPGLLVNDDHCCQLP